MAEVTHLSGTAQKAHGFRVKTSSAGKDYEYDLRETGDGTETVELVARRVDGEEVEADSVTETVREAVREHDYEVAE